MRLCAALLLLAAGGEPQKPEAVRPLHIQSDRLEISERERRAIFSGHVEAKKGDLVIRCDRLEVSYALPKRSEAKAPLAEGDIRSLVCTGNVEVEQGERLGHCERADYDHRAERLVCTGKPWVTEGENRVEGERITYLLDRSEVQVEKPRAVLHLEDAPPGKDKGAKP